MRVISQVLAVVLAAQHAAHGSFIQQSAFTEQDKKEAEQTAFTAASDHYDSEEEGLFHFLSPASHGESCGFLKSCVEDTECVGPALGKRCFPQECYAMAVADFQKEFDFDAYKEKIFAEAGIEDENDLIPTGDSTFLSFQDSPQFQALIVALQNNSINADGLQERINACHATDDSSTKTNPTSHAYVGVHLEAGAGIDGVFEYFAIPASGEALPREFIRLCGGAEIGIGIELSLLVGVGLTGNRGEFDTNAITFDADVAVVAAGGMAVHIGLNGIWFLDWTFGIGIGAGLGLSYCDTITLQKSQAPTPVPTSGGAQPQVLLIDNGSEGFGTTKDLLVTNGYTANQVTEIVDESTTNGFQNLLNGAFLQTFALIVYCERSDLLMSQAVHDSLEAYIQAGGHLIVTGYHTLHDPSDANGVDPLLADLLRLDAMSADVDVSGVGTYQIFAFSSKGGDVAAPPQTGPFGTFTGGQGPPTNLATNYDLVTETGDMDPVSFTAVQVDGPFIAFVQTYLDVGTGSVGFWNGGPATGIAQPDFTDGSFFQGMFLNWVEATAGGLTDPNNRRGLKNSPPSKTMRRGVRHSKKRRAKKEPPTTNQPPAAKSPRHRVRQQLPERY